MLTKIYDHVVSYLIVFAIYFLHFTGPLIIFPKSNIFIPDMWVYYCFIFVGHLGHFLFFVILVGAVLSVYT